MGRQYGFLAWVFLAMSGGFTAMAAEDGADPYLWLEDVEGERALDWVRTQNERSLKALENTPAFNDLYKEALTVLTSDARLPLGSIHNGAVYNFWQDETHIRGLWRRASVASYRAGSPDWETLIDFDALAKTEGENWVHGDIVCLSPDYRHCMIEMSYGGKDAAVWREFDTDTKTFVEDGFFVPEAKTWLSWVDKDTLLITSEFGEGSLTKSGYGRYLKRWVRGEALSDAATVLTVDEDDVWVFPYVDQSDNGPTIIYRRGLTFFESVYFIAGTDGEATPLPLPKLSAYEGVIDNRVIFFLREDWAYQDAVYGQGSLVAYDLDGGAAEIVMAAANNQSIESVHVGKSSIVVQYLEDVSGKAARLVRGNDSWALKSIAMPENGVVDLVSGGGGTDDAMLSFESMTMPDSLYYVEGEEAQKIAETAPFYDASDVVVEQRFATSADGTEVPYFIMAKKDVLAAGNAPTVQYGYGGFLAPILPVYYEDPSRPQHGALAGLMWVNRGGVLVLSNIRGGTEYGPRWHEAALKGNRQRSFDDFIAISEDLIESGVTSAEKLGAIGRSNGGLLMGAIMTQRPELYAALDIGVPLLDMKRYNKLLAGASWMGEYGNPDLEEDWAYISQYSPYQLLSADKPYPKVLFYTSTKDDRVHPGHARKAAAKLADLGYDFFYYENIEGGHGGTANQDQLAYRTALEYAYFAHMLMGDREGED